MLGRLFVYTWHDEELPIIDLKTRREARARTFPILERKPYQSQQAIENMSKNTQFKPGQSGNPETMFKPGNQHRWVKGVSGNPIGKSRHRAQFEEAFNEALITEGSPEEAAKLLWEAARAKEPWAIQSICQRFAPQAQSLQLIHEVNDHGIDYAKLTDEQIQQLDSILEQASLQPPGVEGGEGPASTT